MKNYLVSTLKTFGHFVFTLVTVAVMLSACKNSKSSTSSISEPTGIIVLLEKSQTPSTISLLKEYEVVDEKRTSRSQNLWLVQITDPKEGVDELIEKLKKQEGVLDAYQQDDKEPSNSTNNAKGKASPKNE